MNSGLPSLLDAIFGKQNLDTVSLDEIYELINEFPSFNAGHFLLSKKLKAQEESSYEKETKRTALYFNNPFWLESVLNEESHLISERKSHVNRSGSTADLPAQDEIFVGSETQISESPAENVTPETKPLMEVEPSSIESGITPLSLKENQETEESTDRHQSFQEQPLSEYSDGPVKSFDDLISKYHIESLTTPAESFNESSPEAGEQPVESVQPADKTDSTTGSFTVADEGKKIISDDYEIREEVINEYGIFEEVKVKKTDFDLEAFDRPVFNLPEDSAFPVDPATKESTGVHTSNDGTFPHENREDMQLSEDKNTSQEESDRQRNRADYDAFDRPVDEQAPDETYKATDPASEEESIAEIYSVQDLRMESAESQWEPEQSTNEITPLHEENAGNEQIQESANVLEEQQKPFTPFDPKKAESIVFAPYHMIDYFASQGIKLNLEDNPADSFGRQLKSFTDWLKVMKKLPPQSIAEKTDEREVDRIRHFAAHSIDEREILTESMAEVLAKQGMYENAIALFQKLSLIYPPKSAYFASRIEQIKASLP